MLHETGYDMIAGHPEPEDRREIRGLPVYDRSPEIDRPVDMVEVFRPKEEFYG